jgi:hypothetical protein
MLEAAAARPAIAAGLAGGKRRSTGYDEPLAQ